MLKADLHTHTVACNHAFSTISEMAMAAKQKGIEILGITEHGPAVFPNSPPQTFFRTGKHTVPKEIDGVKILFGVEANVIDEEGRLDLPDELLKELDIVIVGFHKGAGFEDSGREKNTQVMLKVLEHPLVKIISHPYNETYDADVEKIAQTACDNNKLIEINSAYFYRKKPNFEDIKRKVAKIVAVYRKNNKRTIINSDAHIACDIGRDTELRSYFSELDLREEDFLNNDIPALEKILKTA